MSLCNFAEALNRLHWHAIEKYFTIPCFCHLHYRHVALDVFLCMKSKFAINSRLCMCSYAQSHSLLYSSLISFNLSYTSVTVVQILNMQNISVLIPAIVIILIVQSKRGWATNTGTSNNIEQCNAGELEKKTIIMLCRLCNSKIIKQMSVHMWVWYIMTL